MLGSRQQIVDQNRNLKTADRLFEKYVTAQVFGNDSNSSKFDSGG
jgi:hypothetical protein